MASWSITLQATFDRLVGFAGWLGFCGVKTTGEHVQDRIPENCGGGGPF